MVEFVPRVPFFAKDRLLRAVKIEIFAKNLSAAAERDSDFGQMQKKIDEKSERQKWRGFTTQHLPFLFLKENR